MPRSTVDWDTVETPEGVEWITRPIRRASGVWHNGRVAIQEGTTFERARKLEALATWSEAHNVYIEPDTSSVRLLADGNNVIEMFVIAPRMPPQVFTCEHGGRHIRSAGYHCTHNALGGIPWVLCCYLCRNRAAEYALGEYRCRSHNNLCSICEQAWVRSDDLICRDCSAEECGYCGEPMSNPDEIMRTDTCGNVHSRCYDRATFRYCEGCDRDRGGVEYDPDQDMDLCQECRNGPSNLMVERFDEDTPDTSLFRLQPHPHRPVRMCSVELETTGGGNSLANRLYQAGLTQWDSVTGYHSSESRAMRGTGRSYFCHVERDSSLGSNGGELVLEKMQLDGDDADKLYESIRIVRSLIAEGGLRIDQRCGLHIHIDAKGFGIGHTRNLVTLTNYLEDPIYRLAAANYDAHRGLRYAGKINKTAFADNRHFGREFFRTNGHESALNTSYYWQAIRTNCNCGASIVGEFHNCDCDLGMCTFEFRFFNSTSSHRQLHAYIALTQALTSFARCAPELDPGQFTALEYFPDSKEISDGLKNEWELRLRWMLRNLVLNDEERISLRYTVDRCIMSELGTEVLDDVFSTTYAPDVELAEVAPPTASTPAPEPNTRAYTLNTTATPASIDWSAFVTPPTTTYSNDREDF